MSSLTLAQEVETSSYYGNAVFITHLKNEKKRQINLEYFVKNLVISSGN